MEKETTAIRLKKIMEERNLRQADILELAKPYCEKYGIRLGRPDISQYVSGKTMPNQNKLYILARALNVNEAWLMGYGDNPARNIKQDAADKDGEHIKFANSSKALYSFELTCDEIKMIQKYRELDEHGTDIVDTVLTKEHTRCIDESKHGIVLTKELLERIPFEQRLALLKYENEPELKLVARKRKKENKNV